IAVLRDGRIEQLGDAQSVYERPRTRFVSQFLGTGTLVSGRLVRRSTDGFLAETPLGPLWVATPPPNRETCTLVIRPERIRILPNTVETETSPAINRLRTRVVQSVFAGSETHYELRSGTETLRVETLNASAATAPDRLRAGGDAWIELPPDALVLLDD
ncbi:MAG: TOBE domain-containing protein, partial [Verrucomicrobiales bacterium]|nr:TOBE domain-containing protein [Verrucomicrobiales bacterium]